MKSIGIDIGTFSVKVAEVENTRYDFNLINFFEFPLSQIAGTDHQLEIIEILRKVATNYDPAHTRYVIGLAQGDVSVRFKRFPFKERQKILKSVSFELEDEIPLDLDEAIFDAKICQYVGPSMADVLAFAVPEEAVRTSLDRVRECTIDPEILSAEGVALSNLFESWNTAPRQVPLTASSSIKDDLIDLPPAPQTGRLILHLGHSSTLALVYREGALVSVRSLMWGGRDVAAALSQAFSLPIHEGLKVLKGKTFILMNTVGASKDQVLLSQTVSSSLNGLIHELKLSLLDLRSEFHVQLSSIELLGPVSQIQNIGAYLTQALEIPANNFRFEGVAIEASAAVATGLAIEGLKRPRNPAINFRKGPFARKNLNFHLLVEKWKKTAAIATAALLLFFVYSVSRDTLASRLADKADESLLAQGKSIAGLKGESQIERYIKTQKTKIKNREVLAQLDGVNSALDVLAHLAEKFPIGEGESASKLNLDVQHVSIHNEDFIIEGKVQNSQSVNVIEQSLKQVAVAESVKRATPAHPINGPGTAFAFHARVSRQ
jgi:general secretion pathway protein L